jgi:hypothetical protein
MDSREPRTSPLTIAIAWILVTVPLGWGVYQSVVKSLPLFRMTTAAPAPTRSVERADPRSHAPRGNAVGDAPRRPARDAERPGQHSHAPRGNER